MVRNMFYLVLVFFIIICEFSGAMLMRQYLQSPCPDIFQYSTDKNNYQLYGVIHLLPPHTNILQLQVEMSVGNHVGDYNGRIELAYSKEVVKQNILAGRPIEYFVYFPEWHRIPPKITKIVLNDDTICTGPKIQMDRSTHIITTITLEQTLILNIADLNIGPAPPQQNLPQNYDINFKPLPPDSDFVISKDNPFLASRNQISTTTNTVPITTANRVPTTTSRIPTTAIEGLLPPLNAEVLSKNPFLSSLSTPNSLNGITTVKPLSTTTTERIFTTSTKPLEVVKINDKPDLSYRVNGQDCGISTATNQLVVHGDNVPRGAYPWLVAIFWVTNESLQYICSGSLISKKHVITAAHCVVKNTRKLRPQEILLIFGKLNIQKIWVTGEGEKLAEPYQIHTHPDYKPMNSDADIAVVVLNEAIEYTAFIRPVCLWMENNDLGDVVGERGTVIGWGKNENGVVMTSEPKQVKMPIVSQEDCLRSSPSFQYITSVRTFCAGFRNGSGPCNGDSGSGFILKVNGRWFLRGVVSISIANPENHTCDLSNYVVFTDASKFMKWILSFVN